MCVSRECGDGHVEGAALESVAEAMSDVGEKGAMALHDVEIIR